MCFICANLMCLIFAGGKARDNTYNNGHTKCEKRTFIGAFLMIKCRLCYF